MGSRKINGAVVRKIIELGQFAMQFGRVKRITLCEDGVTPESDTDHTVMLSLVACSLAADYKKDLNIGLVAQFALVHDLVEVYAGDTPNPHGMAIDKKSAASKEKRERAALRKIEKRFGKTFPWLPRTIRKYEKLDTKEARFIKVLDKAMPKVTHSLNGVKALKDHGYDKASVKSALEGQVMRLQSLYGKDQTEVIEILSLLARKAVAAFEGFHRPSPQGGRK
ncbi:MAG: HD domain-containing protein [bacterium]|nr:HD domain-containing protein [bacterium]